MKQEPGVRGKQTVIVVGAGVGGLTAAHELNKRGFHVIVYDRRKEEAIGGKARSVKLEGDQAPPFGEHGFRFFPAFYRHVVQTMSEIPFKGSTVAQNLVSAEAVLFTSYDISPFSLPLNIPWKSFKEAADSYHALSSALRLGLTGRDFAQYSCRMWELLTSCEARRAEFEKMSWWQFLLGKEPPSREVAYADLTPFERYIAIGLTRNLVAAKAEEANALTVGRIGWQLLLSMLSPWRLWRRITDDGFFPAGDVDRVLNGPTNEVWINPWVAHLKQNGVEFRTNVNLKRIDFNRTTGKVDGLEFEPARKIHKRVHELAREKARDKGFGELSVIRLKNEHPNLIKEAEREVLDEARSPEAPDAVRATLVLPTQADYYVFALPVEQMAELVEPFKNEDERLRGISALKDHVEWMTGIQYFLNEGLGLALGHHDHLDSEWALTSVEQTMFWSENRKGPFERGIKAILSVDVSEWNKPGRDVDKPANDCTPREISDEVWKQLKDSLNVGGERLRDSMRIAWFLDDDIDQRRDPPKENAVPISVGTYTERSRAEPTLLVNYEPLLVNKRATAHLRPEAGPSGDLRTPAVRNMFLASDYVKTFTDIATMEAANEAARRAVNALLQEAKSLEPHCQVVPLREPFQFLRSFDGLIFRINPRLGWRWGFEAFIHATVRSSIGMFRAINWAVGKIRRIAAPAEDRVREADMGPDPNPPVQRSGVPPVRDDQGAQSSRSKDDVRVA